MIFSTIVRTDMAGVAASFRANKLVKVFRHSEGWSVDCPEGLLVDSGTDKFSALEPLLEALKSNGVDQVILEF